MEWQDYDNTDKFILSRSIPQFKEYILVDNALFYIEQFNKICRVNGYAV